MELDKKLTKKELKALRREERREQEVQHVRTSQKKKWFFIGALVMVIFGSLGLLIYKANQPPKPLPGIAIKELGRDHITDISGITYTSNPPTSGDHFAAWAKRGRYNKIISDGYLLHSLEHGYIVISYNCGTLVKNKKTLRYEKGDPLTTTPTDAKALMSAFTPEQLPVDTVSLPKSFTKTSCTKLVTDLSSFLNDFQRIVIVPRMNQDVPIVLSAWGRMEKFHPSTSSGLSVKDLDKMREFISAFHNAGPEQTSE